MSKKAQPPNVFQLPNGVLVRPKNITRVIPYGLDFKTTQNSAQWSETYWVKIVEGKTEHSVKFETKKERDDLMDSLISRLNA